MRPDSNSLNIICEFILCIAERFVGVGRAVRIEFLPFVYSASCVLHFIETYCESQRFVNSIHMYNNQITLLV